MATELVDDSNEAALVAAMLASDKVPDKNQAGHCFSCDTPMKGLYCTECGQKNDNYRRSIFALAGELIGSIFSLDSRIWQTWGNLLLRPGRVPREFADGARTKWSSPVRIYLAMSIILFGFMSWTNTHLMSLDVEAVVKDGVEKPYEELTEADLATNWQTRFFETQKDIDTRNAGRDFKLLDIWLKGNQDRLTEQAEVSLEEAAAIDEELPEALKNLPETNVAKTEDGGFNITIGGERLGGEQGSRFMMNLIKSPALLTDSFNKYLPRLMFFMMPFTMLLGAIFIRDKKRALLFDHLVHAAYIHALAFFLFLAGILLSKVLPGIWVFRGIFIMLLIYLPWSLKRMFGRGWFKTIMASYMVGFIYLFIMILALTGFISWDISKTLALA